VIAQGAGAEMRRTLGTAVFAGMIGVTLFGIFLTPVFFSVVDRASESAFFRTKEVRLIGRILLLALVVATFGLFGVVMLLMGRRVRAFSGKPKAPAAP
jgi:multidrug efflux pump